MRLITIRAVTGLAGIALAGCTAAPPVTDDSIRRVVRTTPPPGVVQAGYAQPVPKGTDPLPPPRPVGGEPAAPGPAKAQALGLPDLVALTLERHPRLARVGWAVETARGRAIQAGLYPNPTVNITGNELGDRTGPGGVWTTPLVSQEIVTGNKLGLSTSAALKEVDQATLNLIAERYRVLTEVRQAFFEVVTLERRAEILTELVKLAEKSVETVETLRKEKEAVRLDVIQLEVDLERYRAELDATRRSLPGAYRRLAGSVGAQDMPAFTVVGTLETPLPDYSLERLRVYLLGVHPEVRSAQIGVERARLLVRRAEVEPIPNLTVSTGYTRQNQNKSSDWDVGVSLPFPVWNRNQGNVLAAKAQLGEAIAQVGRVENDLVVRLGAAHSAYAAARQRAERYRTTILPKAQETYDLSVKAYQGGQFEYLRVLQAQRALAESRLEYVRALGEMWRAAGDIAGLTLEDEWPLPPAQAPPKQPDRMPEPNPAPPPKELPR